MNHNYIIQVRHFKQPNNDMFYLLIIQDKINNND
jgi:hypothetical protein